MTLPIAVGNISNWAICAHGAHCPHFRATPYLLRIPTALRPDFLRGEKVETIKENAKFTAHRKKNS
jgi:hypothetical protein